MGTGTSQDRRFVKLCLKTHRKTLRSILKMPRRPLNPDRLILRLFRLGGFSEREANSVYPFLRTDFLEHIFIVNSFKTFKVNIYIA